MWTPDAKNLCPLDAKRNKFVRPVFISGQQWTPHPCYFGVQTQNVCVRDARMHLIGSTADDLSCPASFRRNLKTHHFSISFRHGLPWRTVATAIHQFICNWRNVINCLIIIIRSVCRPSWHVQRCRQQNIFTRRIYLRTIHRSLWDFRCFVHLHRWARDSR